MKSFKILIIFFLTLIFSIGSTQAKANGTIAIVLDDIGNSTSDKLALTLPIEVTFSILPFTPKAKAIAKLAFDQGRELILHLPMEAKSRNKYLGRGALMEEMTRSEITMKIEQAIDFVPYIQGVNNHMGSNLTAKIAPMSWVMKVLNARGLYFLDSRTTEKTVAESTAKMSGVPALHRHVFLDNIRTEKEMEKQIQTAIKLSASKKNVIIIAHPYTKTIKFLKKRLLQPLGGAKLISLGGLITPKEHLVMKRSKEKFQQANNNALNRNLQTQ